MDALNTTDIRSKIGKYTLLGEIGRGATSRVHRGKDLFAGREVAIKIVRPEPGVDETARRRLRRAFLTEASMVGKLNHPHIIELYDADLFDDFVMRKAFARFKFVLMSSYDVGNLCDGGRFQETVSALERY